LDEFMALCFFPEATELQQILIYDLVLLV
jgi:hypothetical protein